MKQVEQKIKGNPMQLSDLLRFLNSSGFILLILLVMALLFTAVFSWIMISQGIDNGVEAAAVSYKDTRDSMADEAYHTIYQDSYTKSEKKHHVTQSVEISLGNIQEIQKLEVLKVCEVDYRAPKPKDKSFIETITDRLTGNATSWLEVPCNGVFTIDLKASEFIVDNQLHHIIVRVPNPELNNFTIDYKNVQSLYFKDGGIFNNSAKVGIDEAMAQLQGAELTIMQKLLNNQESYKTAVASAEALLKSMIINLNPQISDLTVEVEFCS